MAGPRPEDRLLRRDRPVVARRTALLLVDVQNDSFNERLAAAHPWYAERVRGLVLPNLRLAIDACRRTGAEVIYTVIENLTADGRDRSLDYKLSGFFVEKGSWEARVLDEVAPGADDIVLPKTSSSLFNSTSFEYVLRNIGVESIAVTGFLTDQCVDQTLRDGADRGFFMLCVEDACATHTRDRHEAALGLFAGYCRTLATADLVAELEAGADRPA